MKNSVLSFCFVLCFNFLSAQSYVVDKQVVIKSSEFEQPWFITQRAETIFNKDGIVAGYWVGTFVHRQDENLYCGYLFGKRVKSRQEVEITLERQNYRVTTDSKKYTSRKINKDRVCTEYDVFSAVPSKGEYILIDNKKVYGI